MNKLQNFRKNFNPTSIPLRKEMLTLSEEILKKNDFPTTKNEKWKYTRLGKLSRLSLEKSKDTSTIKKSSEKISEEAITIEIINGFVNTISDLPKGLIIKSLKDCSKKELAFLGENIHLENEVFHCLNSLYIQDGIYIEIEKDTKLKEEIHIVYNNLSINTFNPTRLYINSKSFSEANIVELFKSDGAENSFVNPVNEAVIHENAKLSITKIQNEEGNNFHIGSDTIYQKKDSFFKCNTITLKGQFIRNNIYVNINGTNCETHLNGAYLMDGKQHVDNQTKIDHFTPNCESHELYKGILDEKATAIFNGKVIVHPDAQKINAFQSNANVLISDDANVNSKPELEIYADDVKCSHGSTTGQLDENAIYYLRSRGISKRKAQAIVSQAFIKDVFSHIDSESSLSYIFKTLEKQHNWEFLD
ncbi:MAG: Fe-S cluster assembly protein SufD [Crocinitomicaceae bacterium]|nr:Fe-S cluster assembly protein SufD [Crocinitomicaceae bacterium]